MDTALWPRLTTWAALGVAAAGEAAAGRTASVKWPNDVYLAGRKVAGILIELGTEPGGAPFAVVGIGVNVNHEAGDFPAELAGKAGSIREATGFAVDRVQLAVGILRELDRRYPQVEADFGALVAEAEARSVLLGKWVAVQTGAGTIEGLAEGLDAQGQLLLRRADGEVAPLNAGEVSLSEK
jgi:BirA family biotin operon repressor/biotin-[acetyl-CoA-carboxylase] ligase